MEPDKGWFLYLQKNHELLSLNISKLLAWSSLEKARRPSRPDFKLVNASCYPDGSMVPFGTRYMIVGSNPYIVGGQFGCPHPLLGYDYWPNFDVIACDPPTDDPCKSNLPMLSGPKFYPFVITLGNKIYVLSLQYRGYMTETWPALFEVYNPESGKWKILPNPPFVVGKTVTSPLAHHYCALGHKLVVIKTWSVESYVFDTREEKWEPWNSREDPFEIAYKPHPTLARFKDFLVAVHQGDFGDVLTYRLDSYGIPRPGRNLVELENIFLPPLDGCFPFITEINDAGLMCIVCYSGIEHSELWRLRVVVFQVSISGHLDNQFLCADIKAKGTYYFSQRIDPIIFPPVITSDRLDKHDNKPDVFWKKENLPRLDRELYDAWCSWYWGALKGSSSSSGHTQDGQEKEGKI